MSKINISATLERDVLRRLDALAERTERNRSWLIGQALGSYFEDLEDIQLAKQRLAERRLTPVQLRREIGV